MINTQFLHHLKKLNLIIRKRITSNFIGERSSKAAGRGLIFKDHAPYAPGDDFRSIAWDVYARTDKLFVKRYEEERNLQVHILVDFSASMNFGKHIKKWEYASMVGIGYAYIAMKNNERFVLSTFSDKLEMFKPKKGKKQLAAILDHLRNKTPEGNSDFRESLRGYRKRITSSSLIVVISDFLYDPKEVKATLLPFVGHDVHLIQVLDPVERELTVQGDLKLRDLETGGILRTFISSLTRKKYQKQLTDHNAKLQNVADELKAKFHSATTDDDIFELFYTILR